MAEHQIRLVHSAWTYDDAQLLGAPGSFGAVFRGKSPDGASVAVKRLHVSAEAAAHRELSVAEELRARPLLGVIPVLDSGEDASTGAYFVVMALAEGSLEDHVRANGGRLS